MKSYIIFLLLLIGIIFTTLIAAHSHDFIEQDEASGSGHNSAEEFMNEMVQIFEEEYNSTDYSSGDSSE
ncbi:hypothetical protein KR200_000026, partial [Drosophila serrata]